MHSAAATASDPFAARAVPGGSPAELAPLQRQALVLGILALHLAGLWGLWQLSAVRDAVMQATPIFVSWVAPPAPIAPPLRPPASLPKPAVEELKPLRKPSPLPRPTPLIAAPPTPSPVVVESFVVAVAPPPPPMPPVAAARSAPAEPTAVPAPPPPAPPAAVEPRMIPDDAVQFLQAPEVAFPRLSQRRGEVGLVIVRAHVGTSGGAPRSVSIERTSGHTRLDDAALAAVRKALFKPYAEKGQPVEGWALVPIRFELEK